MAIYIANLTTLVARMHSNLNVHSNGILHEIAIANLQGIHENKDEHDLEKRDNSDSINYKPNKLTTQKT